jgi:diguanylate cyclase (GGDEF)-like protein
MSVRTEFLSTVRIFADLEAGELEALEALLHSHELRAGEVLFREGDSGGELFVVDSGSLGIWMSLVDGQTLEIAAFGPGDFFGEMSIFENEPRSASCQAKSACRLLSLNEKDLFRYMDESPASAAKIMGRMLSVTRRRLQDTSGFLSDMVQWGEEARRRAITDPLTGLYNRRYLDEALEDHIIKARTIGQPLCLVMLDLDRFREINEGYSQETGDAVIVAAAQVFRRHLRDTDIAARYGGDEFTFLLPGTDAGSARVLLEAIRADVESLRLSKVIERTTGRGRAVPSSGSPPAELRVTTSQGLACYPEHARDLKVLRELADAALYQAKEQGRNRVVAAPSPAP